jgi:hypothetical protein
VQLQYKDFNQWAHDYYLSRFKKNTNGILCVDAGDIDDFLGLHAKDLLLEKLFYFKELNVTKWSGLLKQDTSNRIPLYFGLIALQCYAASKMEDADGVRAKDYQKRLMQLIGLNTPADLQGCFSEQFSSTTTIQEEIWRRSSIYLRDQGIIINLPEKKTYKGRYIQFPISQVILNVEDLKEYISIFKKIGTSETPMSKDFFLDELRKLFLDVEFKRVRNKKLQIEGLSELAELQIFNYFCGNWRQTEFLESQKSKKQGLVIKQIADSPELLIVKISEQYQLYDNRKPILLNSNLFSVTLRNGKLSEHKFCVFQEIEGYENEFELTSNAQLGEKLIFVLATNYNFRIETFLRTNAIAETAANDLIVFELEPQSGVNAPEELRNYFRQPYPVKLRGFKISRKREYIQDFGPFIEPISSQTVFSVYHEGLKMDYDRSNIKPGEYKVRTAGYTDLKFKVIPIGKLHNRVEPHTCGWNILTMSPHDDAFHLQGALLEPPSKMNERTLMRSWLRTCRNQEIGNSSNQLLKILNRVKNGY